MPVFAFIFLVVPILEIYLLIKAGGHFGVDWTIAAVVGTAVVGAALVRRQGLATLAQVRQALGQGQTPALEIAEGLILLVAGALLLTPGFFTDAVGFLCLVTPLRRWVVSSWFMRFVVTPNASGGARASGVVEGEFRRLDE